MHPTAYYANVQFRLTIVAKQTATEVRKTLRTIRQELANGTFPI
jgi:hypothetical protein